MGTNTDLALFVAFLICSGVAGSLLGFGSVMLVRLPSVTLATSSSPWSVNVFMLILLVVCTFAGMVFLDRTGGVIGGAAGIGFVTALGVCAAVGLYGFMSRTRLGLGLRALSQNPQAASLMGVDVLTVVRRSRVLVLGLFALSGGLFAIPLWHMDQVSVWQAIAAFLVCSLLSRQTFFKLYGAVSGAR